MRVDWAGRRALLRRAAWPIAQTAIGAGTAWAIARYALGHKQPFFAPIAATISLGWTVGRRARKAVQLMTGVAVGIVIADLVVAVIGTGAPENHSSGNSADAPNFGRTSGVTDRAA